MRKAVLSFWSSCSLCMCFFMQLFSCYFLEFILELREIKNQYGFLSCHIVGLYYLNEYLQ